MKIYFSLGNLALDTTFFCQALMNITREIKNIIFKYNYGVKRITWGILSIRVLKSFSNNLKNMYSPYTPIWTYLMFHHIYLSFSLPHFSFFFILMFLFLFPFFIFFFLFLMFFLFILYFIHFLSGNSKKFWELGSRVPLLFHALAFVLPEG